MFRKQQDKPADGHISMPYSSPEIQKNIASLIEVTDALLRGEFDHEATVPDIDAESLVSNLAKRINTMVVNLKTVETPLVCAEEQAPHVVHHANNVVELMGQSANTVLDKADKLLKAAEQLDNNISEAVKQDSPVNQSVRDTLISMKAAMFDIIASQSYQDVARQKLEALVKDLNKSRDWLIEVLIVLNIRKNRSPEKVQKKTELLREVNQSAPSGALKQDLVDDLLAEFGF